MSDNVKPLKWHKFLIYFWLWAGAILIVLGAVAYITGAVYGELKDKLYQVFPVIQGIDIVYGIVLIGIATYVTYIRFQLAGFKQGAPKKLLAMFVLSIVVKWVYTLIISAVMGIPFTQIQSGASLIGELIGTGVNIWLHKIYYDKRAELFVN